MSVEKKRNMKALSLSIGSMNISSAPNTPRTAFRSPPKPQLNLGLVRRPSLPIFKEEKSINVYPNGPVPIQSNLYLYSEPTARQVRSFDVVINVAKEIKNPLNGWLSPIAETKQDTVEYIHVPWQHNESLATDLPRLTAFIEQRRDKRILVHCQQGVSRSASLVIAYIMQQKSMDVNQAYAYVKERAPGIGPNMTLIYQLCEWGKMLQARNVSRPRRSFDEVTRKEVRPRSTSVGESHREDIDLTILKESLVSANGPY